MRREQTSRHAIVCLLDRRDRRAYISQRDQTKILFALIENKTILITGANRGIGRALVDEALRRGARRVYAGTRSGAFQNADERVTPVTLDVTNAALIQDAVENVKSLDVLINNAGGRPSR
jgi:NAD(P)-dependent dehydrogenase (short-subunit alcohol dehydrogenase family)